MIPKWMKYDDGELKRRADREAFFKELDTHIDFVKTNLNLVAKGTACPDDFHLIKTLPNLPRTYESLHYTDAAFPLKCYVLGYVTTVKVGRGSNSGEDFYLFGHITVKKSYPHTLIYPEGLREKITEVFVKTELDFKNNRKFSRTFYTLTHNEEGLISLLYDKNLDELSRHKNIEIELKDNHCIFRQNRKPITKRGAATFCELVKVVHKAFD